MPLVRLLLAWAAIQLPATFIASRIFCDRDAGERWIWGATIGLASAIYLSVASAYIHLYVVFGVWLIGAIVAFAVWQRAAPTPWSGRTGPIDYWLVAILGLVAASRLFVAAAHELPPGWDPTFHLVLAKKILLTRGMIVDWTPFEDIHLNYPIGSHVLVAVLALATRLPVHTVFNYTVPLFGVLTTALVFLFARTVTTSAEVGRYAAAAYGLWANWGSIDYYRWGGLPNLVGMLLFLGALTLLAGSPLDRAKRALLGLLLASMFFTHHHVTMTAACVFAALGIHDFFTCERRRMVDLLWGAAWGLLLGVFYILPYVLKARDLGATSVFETEIPLAPAMMLPGVGLALAILASAGLVWAIASRHANRPTAVLGVTTAALAGLFLCFEYVVPFVSARWWGDAYVAFTPSRFLTDLVYCLAIFAGYALYRLRVLLRLAPGVAMTAVLLLGLTQYSVWQHLYSIPTVPQPKWEAYQWIQAHTAPDTIVLDDGRWSVYGTWRRTAQTSIPVSEPQTRDTPKHRLIEALQSGRRPLAAGAAQVVAIRAEASAQDVGHILWRHSSGVVIVEVWPGANPALR